MYLDAKGEVLPQASTIGAGAAAVPGTVAGLWELHRRFGRLPWARDLAPAIGYAREGFRVSPMLSAIRGQRIAEFQGRTNFLAHFGALTTNATFRQQELALTLQRIAAQGPRGFYAGRTAALIVAEMTRDHGHITLSDLAAYRAVWRAPLEGDWAGYHLITAPLPSSGGILLVSMLAMKADLAAAFSGVAQNSAQYVHLLAEIEKRVFADRGDYLGDPDFNPAPVSELLDPAYLARRAREVNTERPTPTLEVRPGLNEHHNTAHFSIVDRWGNAVANTYTLNDDFGSGQVVSGAGFLLNNEMDDFSAKPGAPNIYGVVGGDANAIAPGKAAAVHHDADDPDRRWPCGGGNRHPGWLAHCDLNLAGALQLARFPHAARGRGRRPSGASSAAAPRYALRGALCGGSIRRCAQHSARAATSS
jgi:gamma-glutamyltranspeptidase/glutathione hydrolase